MLAVASAGSLLAEVVSTTLLQRIVPQETRGRAIGTIQTVGTLAYAAGAFALPILADGLGTAPVLGATAILVVAAGLLGTALVGSSGDEVSDPELAAAARRVAGLPLFAGIPAFRVASTLARGSTIQVAAGEPIIRQGEPADRFYVILDGSVEVTRAEQPGAAPVALRRLGPDDAFGELGLLTGALRSATVTAETPVRLLALDGPVFLDLVTAGPELAPRLLALHRHVATSQAGPLPAPGLTSGAVAWPTLPASAIRWPAGGPAMYGGLDRIGEHGLTGGDRRDPTMTDQDQDKDQDPTKLGIRPTDVDRPMSKAIGRARARATEDEDDVEGHFSYDPLHPQQRRLGSATTGGPTGRPANQPGWFAVAARIVLTSNGVASG